MAEIDRARRRRLFEAKVDRSGGPSACHPWLGCVTQERGYGLFSDGKLYLAHRWLWRETYGEDAQGVIDHLCHTRALDQCPGGVACPHRRCMNVGHMEVTTSGENVLRGKSFSGVNARKTHCKHGHEFTPANTLISKRGYGRRECRACARIKARRRRAASRVAVTAGR